MKKRLIFFLGVLCTFGYYSCKKSMVRDPDQMNQLVESGKIASLCDCEPAAGTNIFDPTCLVASNAQLKKLGEGFGFTEGPAVDKFGNVFFTDQPNNKIHKWATNNGAITTFLSNSGRSNGMY